MFMKKYLWRSRNESGVLIPYAIIECSEETAKKIENLCDKKLRRFIIDKLQEKYPNMLKVLINKHRSRQSFLHDNVFEDYDKSYEKLLEEEEFKAIMEVVSSFFVFHSLYDIRYSHEKHYDEKAIRESAKREFDAKLKRLPVYVI